MVREDLRAVLRERLGREASPSANIIDISSLKLAEKRGYAKGEADAVGDDAGKKGT